MEKRSIVSYIHKTSSLGIAFTAEGTFKTAWQGPPPLFDLFRLPLRLPKHKDVTKTDRALYISSNNSTFISPIHNSNANLDDFSGYTTTTNNLRYFSRYCTFLDFNL